MLSDIIEKLILDMLETEGGCLELKRNDLAEQIGCVPSQINYVISSRFTPERGYVIESRRGGGGFVRITKRVFTKEDYLMHLFCSIGSSLDQRTAEVYLVDMNERGVISTREVKIINSALSVMDTDEMRAEALKKMIILAIR